MDNKKKPQIDWSDPIQVKEYRRAYYLANKEKFQQSVRNWIKNKGEYARERRSIAMKKYYEENKEAHKQSMRRYHEEHREELNRKARERYHRRKAEQSAVDYQGEE